MARLSGTAHNCLLIACACLIIAIGSCTRDPVDALQVIRERGSLIVLIRNTPTVYYEGALQPKGFEYELVSAFADYLDVPLKLVVCDTVQELLDRVTAGEGDFASGAVTRTRDREQRYLFGPGYFTVQQHIVYRRGNRSPDDITDLDGYALAVTAGSSYGQRLTDLREEYPSLSWETTDSLNTEQLIGEVWNGRIDCTVADQNILAINRRYYPGLRSAFPISEQQELAWVINPEMEQLIPVMQEWLESYESSGKLARLRDKYYSMVEIYDYVDIRTFIRRIESHLPRYRPWFEEAASRHNLPWTLLAAQAYQESHWNPAAKSPTGVRGIMMLTLVTAETVGITDRLAPRQSIMGGAQYLARMLNRVPDDVAAQDRVKFALAAYNVGMGHLTDARTLARRLDKNPSQWNSLREVLPLLSNRRYYRDLTHGYARGSEPVRYVHRIYNYQNILEHTVQDPAQSASTP